MPDPTPDAPALTGLAAVNYDIKTQFDADKAADVPVSLAKTYRVQILNEEAKDILVKASALFGELQIAYSKIKPKPLGFNLTGAVVGEPVFNEQQNSTRKKLSDAMNALNAAFNGRDYKKLAEETKKFANLASGKEAKEPTEPAAE